MPNHFLFLIGDGVHFNASSSSSISRWGVVSTHSTVAHFLKIVKEGDLLWFVKSKTGGQIVAVATFTSENKRILDGPLSDRTLTNAELGWDKGKKVGKWDTEIHYKDLYNLTLCKTPLISGIIGQSPVRKYNDNCRVNLITEYPNIVRYSGITNNMVQK